MSTAKQDVEMLLRNLPEDCTIEDIQYHLYVVDKIRKGLEAADRGEVRSHAEVEERFQKWLTD